MANPTFGIEEEYQLVDPGTGGLPSGAVHVLRSSWTDDPSCRSVIQRRLPLTGPPPAPASGAEYEALVEGLIDAGVLPDAHTVYWSVRLSPVHPTVVGRGNAADRQRELRSGGRDMRGLVDWLRAESQLGLSSVSDGPT